MVLEKSCRYFCPFSYTTFDCLEMGTQVHRIWRNVYTSFRMLLLSIASIRDPIDYTALLHNTSGIGVTFAGVKFVHPFQRCEKSTRICRGGLTLIGRGERKGEASTELISGWFHPIIDTVFKNNQY